MALKPLQYTIPESTRVPWTATQEKPISHEYPLNVKNESCEDFIAQTYFRFLWLPEASVTAGIGIVLIYLHTIVNNAARAPCAIHVARTRSSRQHHNPTPAPFPLERLFLTTRAVTNKYHVELPYILANGGGEGEEEESVMWFAVTHEKSENEEEPWLNETWRSKWMERMERREVQVQILLYMLKLSLPGPPSPLDVSSPSKKRRKMGDPPPPSLEDRLEAFMDKLSMWQLVNTLDQGLLHRKTIAIGCRYFARTLWNRVPTQSALLRSKIFPHSPFSDSEDGRATSPDIAIPTKRPRRWRIRVPLLFTLAEEKEREQREGSVGAKRKVLNREISMKRVFKPRERDTSEIDRKEKEKAEEQQRAEEARLKAIKQQERSLGVTLVAATPVKSKTVRPVVNRAGTIKSGVPSRQEAHDASPDPLSMGS
ncbi:hypothetical protein B0H13DRAFT_2421355 [Mycena leptocephala]|nr:hypothetical protein B0H13DRAFT_2421355 [Mycena leptocephala]